jgi:molybdopterin adenylyltransferase
MTHDSIRIGLVSISDRASSGIYEDKGLPALEAWFGEVLANSAEFVTG